jgi:hypothetical protein
MESRIAGDPASKRTQPDYWHCFAEPEQFDVSPSNKYLISQKHRTGIEELYHNSLGLGVQQDRKR